MTQEQVKHIIKTADSYNLVFPEQADEFSDKIYDPVFLALKDGDKTTLEHIKKSPTAVQFKLLPAIEDAATVVTHKDVIDLYIKICKAANVRCLIKQPN